MWVSKGCRWFQKACHALSVAIEGFRLSHYRNCGLVFSQGSGKDSGRRVWEGKEYARKTQWLQKTVVSPSRR